MCVAAIGSSSKPTKRTVLVLNECTIYTAAARWQRVKVRTRVNVRQSKRVKVQGHEEKNLAMQICFPELGARESVIRFLSALLPP